MLKIETFKRDTFSQDIEIYNNDDTPFDLAGYVVKIDLKKHVYDAAPALQFSSNAGGITIAGHIITLSKSAVQMDIDAANYAFDIQIEKNGVVKTIETGTFIVKQDITL